MLRRNRDLSMQMRSSQGHTRIMGSGPAPRAVATSSRALGDVQISVNGAASPDSSGPRLIQERPGLVRLSTPRSSGMGLLPSPAARVHRDHPTGGAQASRRRFPILILNATTRRGHAARVHASINPLGWRSAVSDARNLSPRSYISYPRGARAQAALLAKRLPFETDLRESGQAREIRLILGRDSLRTSVRRRADNG
jgi:hypothetical protein